MPGTGGRFRASLRARTEGGSRNGSPMTDRTADRINGCAARQSMVTDAAATRSIARQSRRTCWSASGLVFSITSCNQATAIDFNAKLSIGRGKPIIRQATKLSQSLEYWRARVVEPLLLFNVGCHAVSPQQQIAKLGGIYPTPVQRAGLPAVLQSAPNMPLDIIWLVPDRFDGILGMFEASQYPRLNVNGVVSRIEPKSPEPRIGVAGLSLQFIKPVDDLDRFSRGKMLGLRALVAAQTPRHTNSIGSGR